MSTKTIVMVGTILALVVWGVFASYSKKETFVNDVVVHEEVEIEQAIPQEWLEEAEKAKEQVLKKKQLEADRLQAIEELKAAQSKLDAIETELGF